MSIHNLLNHNILLLMSYFTLMDFVCSSISIYNQIFSADADVRLARRIRRDTGEKGRDIGMVLDQVC